MTAGPIVIALGSNLGDRLHHLQSGITALHSRWPIVATSPVFETPPIDCQSGDPFFLNAVALIKASHLDPMILLRDLQRIEQSLGRPIHRAKNAPRTIDLDLILFGQIELSTRELTLPHPRFHERAFVLLPLQSLLPDFVPLGFSKTISQLVQELPAEEVAAVRELALLIAPDLTLPADRRDQCDDRSNNSAARAPANVIFPNKDEPI